MPWHCRRWNWSVNVNTTQLITDLFRVTKSLLQGEYCIQIWIFYYLSQIEQQNFRNKISAVKYGRQKALTAVEQFCDEKLLFGWVGNACKKIIQVSHNPPASKASREVANLTERKNLHTPVYGVK